MTSNPKKQILDAFLREIYGEKSPPDQADEILRRLAEGDTTLRSENRPVRSSEGMPVHSLEQDSSDLSGPIPILKTADRNRASWRSIQTVVIAATVLFGIGLVGALIKVAVDGGFANQQVASDEADGTSEGGTAKSEGNGLDVNQQISGSGDSNESNEVRNPAGDTSLAKSDSKGSTQPNADDPSGPSTDVDRTVPMEDRPAPPAFASSAKQRDLDDVISDINTSLTRNWRVNVITEGSFVSNEAWLNRMFEKLLGRAPTDSERQRFANYLSTTESRRQIVEQILNHDDFSREFSNFWAEQFLQRLIKPVRAGTAVPRDQHAALRQFLRQSFQNRMPLDELVAKLITATGSTDPQAIAYEPAAGFILSVSKADDRLPLQVSRVFLGTELQCAKCHTDPLYHQGRTDFHGLKAFLSDVRVKRQTGVPEVIDEPLKRKNPGLFFEDPDGLTVYAPPRVAGNEFPFDRDNPRRSLADAVVTSDRFALAMVDWVWDEIYGYGLGRPGRVTDRRQSPHHNLLQTLAEQMVARDFDFRTALQWTVLADSFALSDEPNKDTLTKDIPKFGGVPFFSYQYDGTEHDPVSSLKKLVAAYEGPAGFNQISRLDLSARTASTLEVLEPNLLQPGPLPIDAEIPDFAKGWGVESEMVKVLDSIAKSDKLEFRQKLTHIYMLALKRMPTGPEIRQVEKLKSADATQNLPTENRGSDIQVLQDVWWAIYRR